MYPSQTQAGEIPEGCCTVCLCTVISQATTTQHATEKSVCEKPIALYKARLCS